MEGFITEVKTIRHDEGSSLTAQDDKSSDAASVATESTPVADPSPDYSSPTYILSILRSSPGQDQLANALHALDPYKARAATDRFDIRIPGPISAQLLNALVSITIPDHWETIKSGSKASATGDIKIKGALLRCLSSVPGISCLVTQLRSLITQSRASTQQAEVSGSGIRIKNILEFLSDLLRPVDLVWRLYSDISTAYGNVTQKQLARKELASQLAAGRVLSVSAEGISLAGGSEFPEKTSWIGAGSQYASWLGGNICHMASKLDATDEEQWRALALLTGRALSLGYTGISDSALDTFLLIFTQIIW